MPEEKRWSICPVEDCEFAQEFDPDVPAFCPDCGLELISECPACKKPVWLEGQVSCNECGLAFKE